MSEIKRTPVPLSTITRDLDKFEKPVGNLYESIVIVAKRAEQINSAIKEELAKKLEEFSSYTDNLEEVFENREQIEISRHYEKLPKPTLTATQEYMDGVVYFKNPAKEEKTEE